MGVGELGSGGGGGGGAAAEGGIGVVPVGWRYPARWRCAVWCGGGPCRLVNVLEGCGCGEPEVVVVVVVHSVVHPGWFRRKSPLWLWW